MGFARRNRSFFRQLTTTLSLLVFISIIAVGIWFYRSSQPGAYLNALANEQKAALWELTAKTGLTLQHIYVEGKHHTPNNILIAALGVKFEQPILAIPLRQVKEQLEQIDWVKYATVERELPNTLHVKIRERKPLAIWQKAGKLYLVDDEGVKIEEGDLKDFSNLLVLIGDDAPLYARTLLDIIKEDPELYSQITLAVRIGERRWNIRFASGLEVKMPEDNPQEAWHYIIKLYHEKKLFNASITLIDLRIADKLYMNMVPDPAKPAEKATK